jgi:hypothetical protein
LVATFPADLAGTECLPDDPTDCGVRVDTSIELRFDRFLLPGSINRQAVAIYTGEAGNPFGNLAFQNAPAPVYDVVERVVTISLGPGEFFQPHTLYTVRLVVFGGEQEYGFRAFDGAAMGAARLPLTFSFYTNGFDPEEQAEVPDPNPPLPDPAFTCDEVVTRFDKRATRGMCAACHDDSNPPMGLDLRDGNTLLYTAIGQVAHQTDVGTLTGGSYENAPRFGVGMPRIDPEQPNNSYLLYKLLIKPENYRRSPSDPEKCETVHRVELAGDCEPSAEEISRMREWFVLGDPMPRQTAATSTASMYRSWLRGLQGWIRDGAVCD